jgi:hypothetical protein
MKKLAMLVVLFMAVSAWSQENFKKSDKMQVKLTSISLEPYGEMVKSRTFKKGDKFYINVEVTGFQANEENKYFIQADLLAPKMGLENKNIIDSSIDADKSIPMYFVITITDVFKGGKYDVKIVVRDMVASTFTEYNTFIMLQK